jgi:effector-binding domain-containing protein
MSWLTTLCSRQLRRSGCSRSSGHDAREPAEIVLLPGVEVASCIRQGTTREVWPRIVKDVMAWIEEHGYQHVGPGRDFYLEINDAEPSKQVFEIQAPLCRPGDPVPEVAPRRLRPDRMAASA